LKFLIIGAGSIGQRHISNLSKIISKNSIYLYDVNTNQKNSISKKFKILPLNKLIFSDFDCIFICTPPSTHTKLAIDGLKQGCNVFIEKPLSANNKEILSLKNLAKKKNLSVFIGYNFRFNSNINYIKKIVEKKQLGKILSVSAYYGQYLPDWRPSQNYQKNYSALKKLGGGIIHDSSHEIDYLVWLLGNPKEIQSNYVKTTILKTDVEALANILLKLKNNILGTIHLDFVRREYKRSLEILCEKGIIYWSLKDGKIEIFNIKNNKWKVVHKSKSVNEMYLNEMKHVVECIKMKRTSKIISLENGINSQKLSDIIIKAGKSEHKIKI